MVNNKYSVSVWAYLVRSTINHLLKHEIVVVILNQIKMEGGSKPKTAGKTI